MARYELYLTDYSLRDRASLERATKGLGPPLKADIVSAVLEGTKVAPIAIADGGDYVRIAALHSRLKTAGLSVCMLESEPDFFESLRVLWRYEEAIELRFGERLLAFFGALGRLLRRSEKGDASVRVRLGATTTDAGESLREGKPSAGFSLSPRRFLRAAFVGVVFLALFGGIFFGLTRAIRATKEVQDAIDYASGEVTMPPPGSPQPILREELFEASPIAAKEAQRPSAGPAATSGATSAATSALALAPGPPAAPRTSTAVAAEPPLHSIAPGASIPAPRPIALPAAATSRSGPEHPSTPDVGSIAAFVMGILLSFAASPLTRRAPRWVHSAILGLAVTALVGLGIANVLSLSLSPTMKADPSTRASSLEQESASASELAPSAGAGAHDRSSKHARPLSRTRPFEEFMRALADRRSPCDAVERPFGRLVCELRSMAAKDDRVPAALAASAAAKARGGSATVPAGPAVLTSTGLAGAPVPKSSSATASETAGEGTPTSPPTQKTAPAPTAVATNTPESTPAPKPAAVATKAPESTPTQKTAPAPTAASTNTPESTPAPKAAPTAVATPTRKSTPTSKLAPKPPSDRASTPPPAQEVTAHSGGATPTRDVSRGVLAGRPGGDLVSRVKPAFGDALTQVLGWLLAGLFVGLALNAIRFLIEIRLYAAVSLIAFSLAGAALPLAEAQDYDPLRGQDNSPPVGRADTAPYARSLSARFLACADQEGDPLAPADRTRVEAAVRDLAPALARGSPGGDCAENAQALDRCKREVETMSCSALYERIKASLSGSAGAPPPPWATELVEAVSSVIASCYTDEVRRPLNDAEQEDLRSFRDLGARMLGASSGFCKVNQAAYDRCAIRMREISCDALAKLLKPDPQATLQALLAGCAFLSCSYEVPDESRSH